MNFLRKSTEGWSVGFTLLDFAGSVATYGQMVMQSIDQGLLSPLLDDLNSSINLQFELRTDKFHNIYKSI